MHAIVLFSFLQVSFCFQSSYGHSLKDCWSVCCTDTGELIVSGRTDAERNEIHHYTLDGKLKQKLPHPPGCNHLNVSLLQVKVAGHPYIAMSNSDSQVISLYNMESGSHSVAWKGSGKEGEPHPEHMSHGGPHELIAINREGGYASSKSITVFDTRNTKFKIKVGAIPVDMCARNVSYIEIPGREGLALVSDGQEGGKVNAVSTGSQKIVWSLGYNEIGRRWRPCGLCSDMLGQVYVIDWSSDSILVAKGQSGKIVHKMWTPMLANSSPGLALMWCDSKTSLIPLLIVHGMFRSYPEDDTYKVIYFQLANSAPDVNQNTFMESTHL